MIDFAGLAAALSGVAGIVVAVGTLILNRQKQRVVDFGDMEQELEQCSRIRGIAMRHIRTLERGYGDLGEQHPERPPELRPGYSGGAGGRGRHRTQSDPTGGDAEPAPVE